MQIILLEKIANVGDLGDVVKVREGYARNFLIPQGKAKRATPENLKAIEDKRADLEKAATERLAAARALAERLEGMAIQVTQKAGVDGRLFGSVTNIDIVDALKSQGVDIERSMIRMPAGPLKQIGDYPLMVALHIWAMSHGIASLFGRGDAARRTLPMSPEELHQLGLAEIVSHLSDPARRTCGFVSRLECWMSSLSEMPFGQSVPRLIG